MFKLGLTTNENINTEKYKYLSRENGKLKNPFQ